MSKQRRLLRLILDFDGTLTKKDTLHLVAQAGYDRQNQRNALKVVKPWSDIVDAYMTDYNNHLELYNPPAALRNTLPQEFEWLNSLTHVENASVERVRQAGVFDDVSAEDMSDAATEALNNIKIQLRNDWIELVVHVLSVNQQASIEVGELSEPVHVISVNWSRLFIGSILRQAIENRAPRSKIIESIAVYANEIPSVTNDLEYLRNAAFFLKGRAVRLTTSGDKLAQLLALTKQPDFQHHNFCSIYIGDSTTDLQCLTSVDVGICIRDEPMNGGQSELAATCERLGIRVEHLSECSANQIYDDKDQNDHRKNLWWARDFEEVLSYLKDCAF